MRELKMLILVVSLCLLAPSWAVWVIEPPIRVDMPPPEGTESMARNVFQHFFTMPIDHFDPQNTDTYQMRFMFNEEFFGGPGSPVFILVGGEWDIAPGWLVAGNMFEMARENKGYQIYTEHRYYGQSLPYQNFTTENLRFLNVDQALADLAYFIRNLRTDERFAESKIILYGGSYAANMVMWFKKRYPHLVVGGVASSGPILAKIDFFEYLEVVHEAFLLEGGEQCIDIIRQGIRDTMWAMNSESGRRLLESNYRLCSPLDYDDIYEMGYFAGMISWRFSGQVQSAFPGSLRVICNAFESNLFGTTPMEQIGGYIATTGGLSPTGCWNLSYDILLDNYRGRTNSRAWWYQVCTEYGFLQTAPRSGTVFDPLHWLSVHFYVDICKQVFDPKFDEEFLLDAAERVNQVFGGLRPAVNNTINIHGYIDPWRALGVYDTHISDTSPTATIDRASHCFDMRAWGSSDTIEMTRAQQQARRLVARWLSD